MSYFPVAHSDSVLTWDFNHELSRCTYAGKFQWAPQWAPARAKWWWVFLPCVRIVGAATIFESSYHAYIYCRSCGRTQCWRGGRRPSYLQGSLPTSAREGGLNWGDPRNCLDFQDPSTQVFYHHPGVTLKILNMEMAVKVHVHKGSLVQVNQTRFGTQNINNWKKLLFFAM